MTFDPIVETVTNFTYPCDDSPDCHYIKYTISPGTYKIEVWGAQGGNTSIASDNGGRGGYSHGLITFCKKTTIYIFIGAKGSVNKNHQEETKKSFNGGGTGYYINGDYIRYGAGGGGATDVRVNGKEFRNRIIVAGGGGGAGFRDDVITKGGYGGGIEGGKGEDMTSFLGGFGG